MSEPVVELEVLRYRPETDADPVFEVYTVPYRDDWVVLDALNHIKDNIDRTLSFRWSCHMAVCGSLRHDDQRRTEAFVPCIPA